MLAKISEGVRTTRKISARGQPQSALEFDRYGQKWAQECLDILNINFTLSGCAPVQAQAIFVGNHMSYLDILLLLKAIPVSFVAKSEMAKWPLFGAAATVAGTVFVDRKSRSGRAKAAQAISAKLKSQGRSVAIFPEGTTTLKGTTWRPGAFRIAQQNNLPLQPFCLSYLPVRETAYIDDDALVPHLWQLTKLSQIDAQLHFGEPRIITNVAEECARAQAWVLARLHNADNAASTENAAEGNVESSWVDRPVQHRPLDLPAMNS